jgi:hypothetical protein
MTQPQNKQNANHELSYQIDNLLVEENDSIRSYLFEKGKNFFYTVTETLSDNYIWDNDQTRIDFEEFIEYVKNDRHLMINWLIETELEYIHDKTDESVLIEAIEKIQSFDRRYMIMLIDNRNKINKYV